MLWRIRKIKSLALKPSSTSTTYVVSIYDAEGVGTADSSFAIPDTGNIVNDLLDEMCTLWNASKTPNDFGCV